VNRGESIVQNAGAWQLFDAGEKDRPQASEGVRLCVDEQLERTVES
jgi:hypothetical protein